MPSLWLTSTPSDAADHSLPTLKAIRSALRVFDPDAGIDTAEAILATLKTDGCALLGNSDQIDRIDDAIVTLEAAGCEASLDVDPSDYGPEPTEVTPTKITDPAYQTAMLLMANFDGNPLRAAAVAVGLARTTGAVAFYTEVVASMIVTFPWLNEMMREQNLLT